MKIITTVGTSLIEKYIDEKNDIFKDLKENKKDKSYFSNIKRYDKKCKNIIEELKIFFDKKEKSAETTTIQKVIDDEKDFEIYLIATDTLLSYIVAEAIKNFYQDNENITVYFDREKDIIKDLRVDKLDIFTKGVDNLINKILNITNGKFDNTILNITGGYKAIIPYLTIIGQISNSKIVYIFENSDALIELPKLPIGFDEKIADLYLPYMNKYILNNISDNTTIHKLINLKLIKNINNKLEVTSLGNFFKNEMNHKPSSFGDLIELLLFSRYSKENTNKKLFQGVEYKNMDCNSKKVEGDIDIIIEDDNLVELYEIKSLSQVKEFLTKQISKYICYIQQNFNEKENKQIILFVYLVEGNLLSIFDEDFKNINLPDDIKFKIQYIELPLNNLQGKIREFKDIQIQEKRIPNV